MAPAGVSALKPGYRTLFAVIALVALNAWLNRIFFLPGEGEYRESIELGYASMARFFSEYPNPFGWNPFQYEGLPAHMWYLPLVPYASAALIHLLPMFEPEHVYRIFVTSMAVLGPATMFLFAVFMTGNRFWPLVGAVCYSLVSFTYPLFQEIDQNHGWRYMPVRMLVLTKYAEGPHNTGLALLPLALAACWRAAVGRRFREIFAAAILLALIPLSNWISAFALAWCCVMMLVTGIGIAPHTGFLGRRLIYAGALAYLLAAFWLTPTFIDTTLLNWGEDTAFRTRILQRVLLAALLAGPFALRLVFLRWPRQYYLCFVTLCAAGFYVMVASTYSLDMTVVPEAWRYAPEMELFLFLALAECCRLLWVSRRIAARALALAAPALILFVCTYQIRDYLYGVPEDLRPMRTVGTIEHQVSSTIAEQHPRGRVYVPGGTRFRFNGWFLIPQLGGTFESGLLNRVPLDFIYFVRLGDGRPAETRTQDAILTLRAAGVEYVAVHGPESREYYRDIRDYEIFDGHLEKIFEQEDDRIYKLPFTGWAHLVRPNELPRIIPKGSDVEAARAWVAAMDDLARPPLISEWRGTSSIEIHGRIPEGYRVALPVSYHENWTALQDGTPVPVSRDAAGHIVVQAVASPFAGIVLLFEPGLEQAAGTILSLIALALALAASVREWRRHRA